MASKCFSFNVDPFTVAISAASDFWWVETDSGGLLGKRRTYLLLGLHPARYERMWIIGIHLLWLRLQVGWIRD